MDASTSVYATMLATLGGSAFEAINQMISVGQSCAATHLADLLWTVGVRRQPCFPHTIVSLCSGVRFRDVLVTVVIAKLHIWIQQVRSF